MTHLHEEKSVGLDDLMGDSGGDPIAELDDVPTDIGSDGISSDDDSDSAEPPVAKPKRGRPKKSANAESKRIRSTDTTTSLTDNLKSPAVADAIADMQTANSAATHNPLAIIQSAIDGVNENKMASWVIDVLSNAVIAVKFRQVFRAAAEQHGEAGVYKLLEIMVKNNHKSKASGLWLAASLTVSSARLCGKGIKFPPGVTPPAVNDVCHRIMTAAVEMIPENSKKYKHFAGG